MTSVKHNAALQILVVDDVVFVELVAVGTIRHTLKWIENNISHNKEVAINNVTN